MRVHVTATFWVLMILNMGWREFTKRNEIQAKLHKLGPLAFFLQWYVLFFVGYGFLLLWSLHEMFHYLSLSEGDIHIHLRDRWEQEGYSTMPTTAEGYIHLIQFRKALEIKPWLRTISWIAVICAPIVFILVASHIGRYAVLSRNFRRKPEQAKAQPFEAGNHTFGIWKIPFRMNSVMLILVNPCVFSVMSMRALCRVWALCTGTAHKKHKDWSWPEEETLENALFQADMELAACFQYFAVHVFARLCGDYLYDSGVLEAYRKSISGTKVSLEEFRANKKEYRRMVKWAAFLVVHAFVVVGIFRCAFDFIVCESRIITSYGDQLESLQGLISGKLDVVFLVLTVLCVINMKLICDMKDITDKMKNASLMFMGTRILLLVADNQALFITAWTLESPLYENVVMKLQSSNATFSLPDWNFHTNQAFAFHLSLVNIEVLLCVAYNIFAWRNLNVEESEILKDTEERDLDDVLEDLPPAEGSVSSEGKPLLASEA